MVLATNTILNSIAGVPFFITLYHNVNTAACSIFRRHGFDALNRSSYLTATKQNEISILQSIYNPFKNPEGVYHEDTSSTNDLYNSHGDGSRLRRCTGVTIESHVDLSNSSYWGHAWSGDGSTLGDLVLNQYRTLPYPAVGQNQLSEEND